MNTTFRLLSQLRPGESGVVDGFESEDPTTDRLREMGLVRGTRVEVRRLAPMGDPIELTVRGYRLSIRISDASRVRIL
ncbi:MAG: ferrous iron transport protein A [Candidatus Omnitrophica bacterium]|jgi:ferrous iron transport protein A|nr:ferrous iron transport protein A [Candidatus Omnitrophota bacterium]